LEGSSGGGGYSDVAEEADKVFLTGCGTVKNTQQRNVRGSNDSILSKRCFIANFKDFNFVHFEQIVCEENNFRSRPVSLQLSQTAISAENHVVQWISADSHPIPSVTRQCHCLHCCSAFAAI
jgi:hypothetical protein